MLEFDEVLNTENQPAKGKRRPDVHGDYYQRRRAAIMEMQREYERVQREGIEINPELVERYLYSMKIEYAVGAPTLRKHWGMLVRGEL